MATRFCTHCGAKVLTGAIFCVECGERQASGPAPRRAFSLPLQRYAPVFVVLTVLAVGAGAVLYAYAAPRARPAVPSQGGPSTLPDTRGKLPAGHPAITIPPEVKQAIRDMAQKAAAAPDDLDAWKHLAEVQYRAGQLERTYLPDAAASYRHVLAREPDNLEAIRHLGNIAFDQEQRAVAIDYYQRYLKKKPDDPNVRTDLGTMYLSAGKAAQAIAIYDAVLQTDPSFFQAQFNLAVAYRALGQPDKMIAALEKARTLATDDKTRAQVDRLLARVQGRSPAGETPAAARAQAAAGPAPAGGGPAASTFRADAEKIFRQNPIMGPKVERIEWPAPKTAKVYLRHFPMDQMGAQMRSMFIDRMKQRIKTQKQTHQVSEPTRFELVDAASGKVMTTITE
ncbi:MAG: tetratricopeptide repeat protein [Candidatus Binatia bacterium]